jgi:dTDP-glucose pyrophosphorylase
MKVVFLMGGGTAASSGEQYPLYLTEIQGRLILEQQVERIAPLSCEEVIFCAKSEDIEKYRVDYVVRQILPKGICIGVHGETQGAVCTALLAGEFLDNNGEVLILAIDDFIEEPMDGIIRCFRENNCGAGLVSFTSVHPRYSFARTNTFGIVVETAEKQPISNRALASFYYFASGHDFVECAKNILRKDRKINNRFYLSQVVNEIILGQKPVGLFGIPNAKYHPLKNEMQLAQYLAEYQALKESK